MGLPPSSVPTSNTSRRQLAAHPSVALISRVQNFRRKMCRTASAPSSHSRPGDGLFARRTCSFTAVDFHHILLASLPAHSPTLRPVVRLWHALTFFPIRKEQPSVIAQRRRHLIHIGSPYNMARQNLRP